MKQEILPTIMNDWVNKIALTPQSGINCFILCKSIPYKGKLEGQKELLSVMCAIVLNNWSQIVASK